MPEARAATSTPARRAIAALLVALCIGGCGFLSGLTNPGSATGRSITLRALPAQLPVDGGTVEIEASVRVGDGAEIGVPVTFRSTGGLLAPASTVITDSTGVARVTLDTELSSEVSAIVYAAGVAVAASDPLVVRVGAQPVSYGDARVKLRLDPKPAAAGSPVALTLRATRDGARVRGRLHLDFGDGREGVVAVFDRKATVEHTYYRPAPFTLVVSITEEDGRLTRTSFSVEVGNGT